MENIDFFNFSIFFPHPQYSFELFYEKSFYRTKRVFFILPQKTFLFNKTCDRIIKNKIFLNSPYCIVRMTLKFLIGSLFDRTSNSSITTEFTFSESSADAAFTIFMIFPWSAE